MTPQEEARLRREFGDLLMVEYAYWRGVENPTIQDFSMGAMGALANVLGAVVLGTAPEAYRQQVAERDCGEVAGEKPGACLSCRTQCSEEGTCPRCSAIETITDLGLEDGIYNADPDYSESVQEIRDAIARLKEAANVVLPDGV